MVVNGGQTSCNNWLRVTKQHSLSQKPLCVLVLTNCWYNHETGTLTASFDCGVVVQWNIASDSSQKATVLCNDGVAAVTIIGWRKAWHRTLLEHFGPPRGGDACPQWTLNVYDRSSLSGPFFMCADVTEKRLVRINRITSNRMNVECREIGANVLWSCRCSAISGSDEAGHYAVLSEEGDSIDLLDGVDGKRHDRLLIEDKGHPQSGTSRLIAITRDGLNCAAIRGTQLYIGDFRDHSIRSVRLELLADRRCRGLWISHDAARIYILMWDKLFEMTAER